MPANRVVEAGKNDKKQGAQTTTRRPVHRGGVLSFGLSLGIGWQVIHQGRYL